MGEQVNKPSLATARKNICLIQNAPRKNPVRRTIVVLGVERGGTSMAAGILRAMGIDMGARAGLNHEDPLFLTDDHDRLTNRIRKRNREQDVWGFKMPKASLHLDFLESTLRNPYYVIVYRNPLSIVDSWIQRGTGSPVHVLERIAQYQSEQLRLTKSTKNPVLMLNYERAVADDASKQKIVEELATFTGVALTDELRERAVGMMTGDGKGYVNLPEHFFLIEARDKPGERSSIPIVEVEPESRDSGGWAVHEKPRPILKFKTADGSNLPKKFWLEIDFESEGLDLALDPLRVYFNFTGNYFPGHCGRPKVQAGLNTFWVETSGSASDFAFGPIATPSRLKVSARMFAADPTDKSRETVSKVAGSTELKQPSRVGKLLKRITD